MKTIEELIEELRDAWLEAAERAKSDSIADYAAVKVAWSDYIEAFEEMANEDD